MEDPGADISPEEAAGLSEFELMRLRVIARNRAKLLALGVPAAVQALQQAAAPPHPHKPPAKKRARKEVKKEGEGEGEEAAAAPTRRATRSRDVKGAKQEEGEAGEPSFDELLGRFVVEEECPRCGKVATRGHRQHLTACLAKGPVAGEKKRKIKSEPGEEEEEQDEKGEGEEGGAASSSKGRRPAGAVKEQLQALTEEELAKQAALLEAKDKAKLSELDLQGLVDYGESSAAFVVLGSRGDPYTVTLSDEARKCQCMDHRIRKHDCKHIKLILTQLGVVDKPGDAWREAVERMFMQHMGSSGGGDGGVKEEAEESKAAGPSRKVAAPRKDKGRDLAERFM